MWGGGVNPRPMSLTWLDADALDMSIYASSKTTARCQVGNVVCMHATASVMHQAQHVSYAGASSEGI